MRMNYQEKYSERYQWELETRQTVQVRCVILDVDHQEKSHVVSETYSGLSRLSRLGQDLRDIVVTVHCGILTDAVYSSRCSSTL